jgi:membrane associated rhomboid family serine protease
MLQTVPPERRLREPIFNIPSVVIAVIGLILVAHALRYVLSDENDFRLVLELAFVPAQWTVAWDPSKLTDILRGIADGSGPDAAMQLALARYVLGDEPRYWTVLTYAVLHGSWAHVILNSLWLAAFGTPVARRCGWLRFLSLAAAAAAGGAAAHGLAHPDSVMPMVGASAAVSGMMAAAARFVFSGSRSAVWSGRLDQPRLSLLGVLTNAQAAMFVGVWFVINLLFGIAAAPLGITDASIAWEAHIGGFLVGLLLFPLLDRFEPVRSRAT